MCKHVHLFTVETDKNDHLLVNRGITIDNINNIIWILYSVNSIPADILNK